jgi:hypothetical protein
VNILNKLKALNRIYGLVESNQNLISYKLKDEDCVRIEGTKEALDLVEEEIMGVHHDLNVTGRRDTCLRVCQRPPFSQIMSDSIVKHHYAEMEE